MAAPFPLREVVVFGYLLRVCKEQKPTISGKVEEEEDDRSVTSDEIAKREEFEVSFGKGKSEM